MQNWLGIGRLVRDVETRYTNSGKAVAKFTIAVDGERKDDTQFVDCVAWEKTAELCSQYLGKGRMVAIKGQWKARTYENKQGQNVKVWEVITERVKFLDRGEPQQTTTQSSSMQKATDYDPFADDDLPF
jgi:single-strand DNA-binding protein